MSKMDPIRMPKANPKLCCPSEKRHTMSMSPQAPKGVPDFDTPAHVRTNARTLAPNPKELFQFRQSTLQLEVDSGQS